MVQALDHTLEAPWRQFFQYTKAAFRRCRNADELGSDQFGRITKSFKSAIWQELCMGKEIGIQCLECFAGPVG